MWGQTGRARSSSREDECVIDRRREHVVFGIARVGRCAYIRVFFGRAPATGFCGSSTKHQK
jgi:hypothetical protein